MKGTWERLIDFRRRLGIHPSTYYRRLDIYAKLSGLKQPELRQGTGKTVRYIRSNPCFERFLRNKIETSS